MYGPDYLCLALASLLTLSLPVIFLWPDGLMKRRFVMSHTPNNKSALAAKLLDRWRAKNQSLAMMLVKPRPPANRQPKSRF
jgi:hypothetical protein